VSRLHSLQPSKPTGQATDRADPSQRGLRVLTEVKQQPPRSAEVRIASEGQYAILTAMQSIETVQRRLAAREASLAKARERLAHSRPGTPAHQRASLDVEQLERAVQSRQAHLAELTVAADG